MDKVSAETMDIVGRLSSDPRSLTEILEALRDAVVIIDNRGFIRFFNRAAEEMTGYRKREVIGRACAVLQCDACIFADGPGRRTDRELERFGAIRNRRCTMRAADGNLQRAAL